MSGIIANGADIYIAALEREADAALRDLHRLLDGATTPEERSSLTAQIKSVRDELERKKADAAISLF